MLGLGNRRKFLLMDDSKLRIEFANTDKKTVIVKFEGGQPDKKTIAEFQTLVHQLLAKGYSNWSVDLAEVQFPTNSFMAFLIAATAFARINNGDFVLTNVHQNTRNNFATFSPLSYLTIAEASTLFNEVEKDEHVIPEIGEDPIQKDARISAPQLFDVVDSEIFNDSETSTIVIDDDLFTKFENEQIKNSDLTQDSVNEKIRVESKSSELYKVCDFVVDRALQSGISEKDTGKIKISVYEACLNVIEHAYHSSPGNWIDVEVNTSNGVFEIVITDFGHSFRKKQTGSYSVERAVENRQTGGFGMHIIKRTMDKVDYTSDERNGNQLTLIKKLPS